MVESLLLCC